MKEKRTRARALGIKGAESRGRGRKLKEEKRREKKTTEVTRCECGRRVPPSQYTAAIIALSPAFVHYPFLIFSLKKLRASVDVAGGLDACRGSESANSASVT